MFRRSLLRAAVAATAVLMLGAGTAGAQTPVRIRIQTAVPSASIYFELLKRMGDRVDKMSAGRVKMEMLPDGAVVGAFEILDAVDKGVVEGGYAWTHYWSGKNPAAGLFSNPMAGAGVGLDQLSHVAWIFEGGGYDLYRKLYRDVLKVNVEPIFVQPMGPDPLGWFKRPIASTEDFKKMKYRSPPGITGEIFKEMGVSAVALPGGEIVTSAQRGVIDAAEWIGPADDLNLGLQTVWKHYYLQGLHQSTDIGEILINKGVWDKLSPDLQEIIRTAAMASMTETYTYNVYRNAQAVVRLRNEFKVEIHDTPKDFFPQFVRATNVVLDRYAQKDAFFKQVLDSQRNFAKTVVPYWTKILDLYSNLGNAALATPAKYVHPVRVARPPKRGTRDACVVNRARKRWWTPMRLRVD
jgi:TRAP-type mannitol/chloroaromatic compound transport system substrate-binding protein